MKNNNHLLKPNTVYAVYLNNQFMIINSKKYRFKLDTTGWNNMERDGDTITTTECFGDDGDGLVVRYPITSVVSLVKQLTVLEEVVEEDIDGDKGPIITVPNPNLELKDFDGDSLSMTKAFLNFDPTERKTMITVPPSIMEAAAVCLVPAPYSMYLRSVEQKEAARYLWLLEKNNFCSDEDIKQMSNPLYIEEAFKTLCSKSPDWKITPSVSDILLSYHGKFVKEQLTLLLDFVKKHGEGRYFKEIKFQEYVNYIRLKRNEFYKVDIKTFNRKKISGSPGWLGEIKRSTTLDYFYKNYILEVNK